MEHIDPKRLLVQIAKILERLKIPYIITGGIAVLVWGRPRFTADIDIVVEIDYRDIRRLERALRELSEAGYVDRAAMERALAKQGEFNFIDGETGVKVDFWVFKNDPFDRSRFKRKVAKKIAGQRIYFTSPEDLILIKLRWHGESQSSRQLEDVESILKISGKELNMKYLTKWAKKMGVSHILKKLA